MENFGPGLITPSPPRPDLPATAAELVISPRSSLHPTQATRDAQSISTVNDYHWCGPHFIFTHTSLGSSQSQDIDLLPALINGNAEGLWFKPDPKKPTCSWVSNSC